MISGQLEGLYPSFPRWLRLPEGRARCWRPQLLSGGRTHLSQPSSWSAEQQLTPPRGNDAVLRTDPRSSPSRLFSAPRFQLGFSVLAVSKAVRSRVSPVLSG